jgi:selenocysteine lyase/cysteine desulfurase
MSTNTKTLGHALTSHFMHRKSDFHHYNLGSFGIAPSSVLNENNRVREQWLSQPDEFWEEVLHKEYNKNVQVVAKTLFGSYDAEFVLVDNTTTAINIVAHSIARDVQPGDLIIMQTTTYPAVVKAFTHHLQPLGVKLCYVKLPFPCTVGQLTQEWKSGLESIQKQHPSSRIRLVVLDHIVSETSLLLPISEMISIARLFNPCEILIDGAHAPGTVDLHGKLQDWNVDYYIGNLHKWCFAPTSVAVMMVKSKTVMHHPIVSHLYNLGLKEECSMLGTRDYSAILSAGAAIEWIESLGMNKVREYVQKLAWDVSALLTSKWKTERGQPLEMVASMVAIGLPKFRDVDMPNKLRKKLRHEYQIEIQNPFFVNGWWWLRISCPCMYELSDYNALADAVLDLCAQ